MATLTKKERETVLVLFKGYTTFYNANSISKVINISHVGAQKIFKRLLQENLVVSKTIGKSITYKLNFNDNYVSQIVTFLLADEANNFKRWKEEFKELFKQDRIIMLFGSTIKDYVHAHDIDLMIVLENSDVKEVNKILKKKEEVLPKKIHTIKLNQQDLFENLKKKDKAFIDIIKNAIVLSGQDKYVEALKHVASF
ncbi:nucleotidyltransferase domain-containing protein [Candidatus Woesearchaeota archaeon]|nr:nucleotidyltransferase domain-containing protein [Candidatus Woesearchaeota archaeon]